jgi:hypothetical protein
VAVELNVGDGNIRDLADTSRRWWKNESALTKY